MDQTIMCNGELLWITNKNPWDVNRLQIWHYFYLSNFVWIQCVSYMSGWTIIQISYMKPVDIYLIFNATHINSSLSCLFIHSVRSKKYISKSVTVNKHCCLKKFDLSFSCTPSGAVLYVALYFVSWTTMLTVTDC